MENPTDRVVRPANRIKRLRTISDKHHEALAALQEMDLPLEIHRHILTMWEAYLALHSEYRDISITLLEIAAKVKTVEAIMAEMNESNPPS
jgi:hypothetical protein